MASSSALLLVLATTFFYNALAGNINPDRNPVYTVEARSTGYELRNYDASTWTTAKYANGENGFNMLFDYISGDNAADLKIDMTAPVLNQEKPEDSETPMRMMFYLPASDSVNPPAPNNENVFTETWPENTMIYVRRFKTSFWDAIRGNTDRIYNSQRAKLEQLMADDGLVLKDDYEYFDAGYNAPLQFWARRDEIWIFADQIAE